MGLSVRVHHQNSGVSICMHVVVADEVGMWKILPNDGQPKKKRQFPPVTGKGAFTTLWVL